jgi:UPF0042 nucleotide-binding protein
LNNHLDIVVFGFKYGVPRVNNFIDVSFLPNPGRMFGLNSVTDHRHWEFIGEVDGLERFMAALEALALSIVYFGDRPMLGIGCNSGRHRSPIVAQMLAERLSKHDIAVNILYSDGG